jgi:hypothetical protein
VFCGSDKIRARAALISKLLKDKEARIRGSSGGASRAFVVNSLAKPYCRPRSCRHFHVLIILKT